MTHHITEPVVCPECKGSGDDTDAPWRPCTFCYGQRVVYVNKPNAPALYHEAPDEPPGHDLPPAA